MKKIICLLFICTNAFAQNDSLQYFKANYISVSLNGSIPNKSFRDNFTIRYGFSGTLTASFEVAKSFGFQARYTYSLLYLDKSVTSQYGFVSDYTDGFLPLHQGLIGPQGIIHLGKSSNLSLYVLGGILASQEALRSKSDVWAEQELIYEQFTSPQLVIGSGFGKKISKKLGFNMNIDLAVSSPSITTKYVSTPYLYPTNQYVSTITGNYTLNLLNFGFGFSYIF